MHPDRWHEVRRLLVVGCDPKTEMLSLHTALSVVKQALPQVHLTVLTLEAVEAVEFSALQEMQIEAIAFSERDRSDQNVWVADPSICTIPLHQESKGGQNSGKRTKSLVLLKHTKPLIRQLSKRQLDAALILTTPGQSPYIWGYLCYLAGIPIRIGQSQEFGGGVLSTSVSPSLEDVSTTEYYLHLLRSVGLTATQTPQPQLVVCSHHPLD